MIMYRRFENTIEAYFYTDGKPTPRYWADSITKKIDKEVKKMPYMCCTDTEAVYNYIYRVLANRHDSLIGIAKCHPHNEFNLEYGKKIAKRRLLANYHKIQDLILNHIFNK